MAVAPRRLQNNLNLYSGIILVLQRKNSQKKGEIGENLLHQQVFVVNVVILPLDTISRSSTKRTEKRDESLKQFRRRRRGRRSLKQLLLLEERALKTGAEKGKRGKPSSSSSSSFSCAAYRGSLPKGKKERKLLLNLLPKTTALSFIGKKKYACQLRLAICFFFL